MLFRSDPFATHFAVRVVPPSVIVTALMQYVVWVAEQAGKSARGRRALSVAAFSAELPTGAASDTTRRVASQGRDGLERRFMTLQR